MFCRQNSPCFVIPKLIPFGKLEGKFIQLQLQLQLKKKKISFKNVHFYGFAVFRNQTPLTHLSTLH